jgi:hypothetical protein
MLAGLCYVLIDMIAGYDLGISYFLGNSQKITYPGPIVPTLQRMGVKLRTGSWLGFMDLLFRPPVTSGSPIP